MSSNVVWFADIGLADLETVGGKNSSLGEMVRELSTAGVRVPTASPPRPRPTGGSSARPGWRR
jgi:phosphoenolpyruvate synthase/pyruvate phosphate dikinase